MVGESDSETSTRIFIPEFGVNLCNLDPSKAKTTFISFGVHDIICKGTVLRSNPKMMKMGTAFTVALRSSRAVSSLSFVIRGRKKG